LLERGANVNAPGRSAVAPVAAAAFNGNEPIVGLLLAKGADPDARDNTGKSAIVYAAARGFTGIVERLLGAKIDVNARHGNQLTILMWAAGHANDVPDSDGLETVELLLSRGARLDDADDRGRTALMMAAELGHAAIVDVLLKRGARADIKDNEGRTAADLADAAVRPKLQQR
jgi:ankyrin repeat protein